MESMFSKLKQYQRKKKENKATQSVCPYIPYDIVVDMLSRLPVKSLLRLRSVCKLWRSLITDPKFASIHLNRSSQRPGALLRSESPLSFHSIDHEISIQDINGHPWREDTNGYDFEIMGSCNGLLVICCCLDFFIWNPLTRYCKKIERPSYSTRKYNSIQELGYYYAVTLCGLGYNSDLDNYKVVVGFNMKSTSYVNIFCFKSNSWKEIEMFPSNTRYCGLATLVNGVPHWKVCSYRDVGKSNQIFSFDLVEDKLKEVPLPVSLRNGFDWFDLQLLNFKGCLCMATGLRSCHETGTVEIWAMKEYGIKDSWSRIFVIPILGELRSVSVNHWVPPYFTGGKIVMEVDCGKKLIVYNPEQITYEVAFYSKLLHLAPFVESLVSPMFFDSL